MVHLKQVPTEKGETDRIRFDRDARGLMDENAWDVTRQVGPAMCVRRAFHTLPES